MALLPMSDFPTLPLTTRFGIFEAVMGQVADGVLLATVSLPHPAAVPHVIYSNAAVSAMTGYAPEEIVGASLALLSGPDTTPRSDDPDHYCRGAPYCHQPRILRLPQGSHTPSGSPSSWSPVTNAAYDTRYLTITLRDITAQKAQQEANHGDHWRTDAQ